MVGKSGDGEMRVVGRKNGIERQACLERYGEYAEGGMRVVDMKDRIEGQLCLDSGGMVRKKLDEIMRGWLEEGNCHV